MGKAVCSWACAGWDFSSVTFTKWASLDGMKWGFAPAADFCSLQINVFPSWRKCYQAAGSRSSWAAEGWTALGSSVRARPPSDLRPPVWSERVHPELNVDAADLTGRRHVWCVQIPDKDQQVLIKTESRVKTSDRNNMAAQKHSWNKKTPCFSLLCSLWTLFPGHMLLSVLFYNCRVK